MKSGKPDFGFRN